MVETLRARLDIKNSETENSKCMDCAKILKNHVTTSNLNFFRISGFFLTCFGYFLPANTTDKKLVELCSRRFTKPFLCDIQSLKTITIGCDQDL